MARCERRGANSGTAASAMREGVGVATPPRGRCAWRPASLPPRPAGPQRRRANGGGATTYFTFFVRKAGSTEPSGTLHRAHAKKRCSNSDRHGLFLRDSMRRVRRRGWRSSRVLFRAAGADAGTDVTATFIQLGLGEGVADRAFADATPILLAFMKPAEAHFTSWYRSQRMRAAVLRETRS